MPTGHCAAASTHLSTTQEVTTTSRACCQSETSLVASITCGVVGTVLCAAVHCFVGFYVDYPVSSLGFGEVFLQTHAHVTAASARWRIVARRLCQRARNQVACERCN